MKSFGLIAVMAACLLAGPAAFAQEAAAPAGSTGQCKDGSYTTHDGKKGACAGHKGVKEWYSAATAAPAAAPAATPAAATPTPAAPAAAPAAMVPKTAAPAATPAAAAKTGAYTPGAVAPGGGAGKVWVNASSKVYHCQGDKWYGTTKKGEYMSEADAKAKGYHGDHGKTCTP
ncbi:DUF3761 domain-containing protein [Dyella tabacisoli]|uniref:DUF3761 domain-containing protein n=1 Tax=Dyella tabacisoli TaxID=2282381 RepID=A0A369URH1_9GAMM|nr:DUF3761 domain-containing protein [Dyella tabacisoli]RDD83362.1 DUF3761 domain-containing protein [Dyella tabacisoli]